MEKQKKKWNPRMSYPSYETVADKEKSMKPLLCCIIIYGHFLCHSFSMFAKGIGRLTAAGLVVGVHVCDQWGSRRGEQVRKIKDETVDGG